jgi:predicted ATPase/DNA-binding winged helix-turn-helix (wHTH) protein
MPASPLQTGEVISFGPFQLFGRERLLIKEGAPVELGPRALDILIALLSHPNEVVSKKDLLAKVWPDVTVEESSLRVQIANLRKALGDGKCAARYITTLAGRGYCFVAPVSRSSDQTNADSAAGRFPHVNLPSRLNRMVGRADDVRAVSARLVDARFVTILGAGGVGKTTVAVAVAHDLTEVFSGAAIFVDLGALSDLNLVTTTLASMLGLSVPTDDATSGLIAYLRDKRILLILDTCEHLIEAVAALASRIFAAAPQVHILATSREALRVEGEHIYRLDPLASPPDDSKLTAAIVQTFPATQLFIERAMASGARLDFSDVEATIAANICRKLDGVALAIELAAGRVEAYGLQQTAALLDQSLTRSWQGQRTAPPRQKSLQATLDWSYGLLSELERMVLRRLAVFVGHFTIEAALAVVASANVDQALVFGVIDSLVSKSMVATHPVGAMMRYRLLDTTRAYALAVRLDDAELTDLAVRHANYYRRWLEQVGTEWLTLSSGAQRALHLAGLANVRAGLEWCFGVSGNAQIGIELAAAAVPVFLAMSLLPECQRWSEQAILALDDTTRGGVQEVRLQSGLGMSLIFTRAHSAVAQTAFERAFAITEEHGDVRSQMLLLGPLYLFHFRTADFKTSLHYAEHSAAVAKIIGDPSDIGLAHCLLGVAHHYMGDLEGARLDLEAALKRAPGSERTPTVYLGFDCYNWAGIPLARNLWLQGHPSQAVERTYQTVKDAERVGHPVTLTIVLHWAASVFLWVGDLANAEKHIDRFISRAETHSLGPYLAVGHGLKGELAIRRGDPKKGVEMLRDCLQKLHAARYELLTTAFNISLVQGLAAMGRFAEGITIIDETIQLIEVNGEALFMPELLRLKAGLLLSLPQSSPSDAERYFLHSLELAHLQGARAWELRTATDLAALLVAQGKSESARKLLRPVFEQFVEGFDTVDLRAAERLLATLCGRDPKRG